MQQSKKEQDRMIEEDQSVGEDWQDSIMTINVGGVSTSQHTCCPVPDSYPEWQDCRQGSARYQLSMVGDGITPATANPEPCVIVSNHTAPLFQQSRDGSM